MAAAAGGADPSSISRGSVLSEVSDDIVEGARADVRAWLQSALDPSEVKTLEADDETMAEAVHEIDVQEMAEELRDILAMEEDEVVEADGDAWDGAGGSGNPDGAGDDGDEVPDEAAVSAAVAAAAEAVLAGDVALGGEDADERYDDVAGEDGGVAAGADFGGDGRGGDDTIATRLPTPPPMDGAISEQDDLERLRIYLETQLGDDMLLNVYRYMKDSEEAHVPADARDARVAEILGSRKQASRYGPLVQRLIDLEDLGF